MLTDDTQYGHRAAGGGDQQVLQEHLREDATAAGAQLQPDGDLTAAIEGVHPEQAGDISAGQQEQRRRAAGEPERLDGVLSSLLSWTRGRDDEV